MLSQKLVLSAAGAGKSVVYVDDVFDTHLRTGDGTSASSSHTVTNGIDLAGEGGLVWVKESNSTNGHTLFSPSLGTSGGRHRYLRSSATHPAYTKTNIDIQFNNNGYRIIGHDGQINQNAGNTYVDWVFRNCPGFFDTQTWTGNGTAGRTISHNLGSVPGAIWIKKTDAGDSWACYFRNGGNTGAHFLNSTGGPSTNSGIFNNTDPTATHFTVGSDGQTNGIANTYIAFIFAHQPNSDFEEEVFGGSEWFAAYPNTVNGPSGVGEYQMYTNTSIGNTYANIAGVQYTVSGVNAWNALSDAIFASLGTRYRRGAYQYNNGGIVDVYAVRPYNGYTGPTFDDEESLIVCGTYDGQGGYNNLKTVIKCGFEPQWVIVKGQNTGGWLMLDIEREFTCSGNLDGYMLADENYQNYEHQFGGILSDGFEFEGSDHNTNTNGQQYHYIAIRRSNKPAETATDVFTSQFVTSQSQVHQVGFKPDMVWHLWNRQYPSYYIGTKVQGNDKYHKTFAISNEVNYGNSWTFNGDSGTFQQGLSTGSTNGGIAHFFKRAVGFFDVCVYRGDGTTSGRLVKHNLGVTPEFILIQKRANGGTYPNSYGTRVQTSTVDVTGFSLSQNAPPQNTGFQNAGLTNAGYFRPYYVAGLTGGNSDYGQNYYNQAGVDYIAYLFASVDGVCKIGGYTGTGSAINVDCGFTSGARFVFVKRVDYTNGHWIQWDSERGIVAGNDPYVHLDNTTTENTGTDYIDPYSAGFTITSSANADLNASGGDYFFLAIA